MRIARALSLFAMFALPAAAAAQTAMPQEAQLQMQIAQNPRQIAGYLDLAKMYVDQKRYNDAEQVLQRAIALVQAERGLAGQPMGVVGGLASGQTGGMFAAPGPAPVRVGGTIQAPTKIKHVNPVYPADALANRIQGIVILEATIAPDGTVQSARVLKSVPGLDQAAVDAVQQWQFTPTFLNGVAVPVIMTVTVNFTLQ